MGKWVSPCVMLWDRWYIKWSFWHYTGGEGQIALEMKCMIHFIHYNRHIAIKFQLLKATKTVYVLVIFKCKTPLGNNFVYKETSQNVVYSGKILA